MSMPSILVNGGENQARLSDFASYQGGLLVMVGKIFVILLLYESLRSDYWYWQV